MNLDDLMLPIRPDRALRMHTNVETVEQLTQLSEANLLRLPNMGRKSLLDIKDALNEKGLNLSRYDCESQIAQRGDVWIHEFKFTPNRVPTLRDDTFIWTDQT